jgi:hypothetical protein
MSTSFEKYSDILLDAFCLNAKSVELAHKKQEILNELFNHYDIASGKVLFIGFSPAITTLNNYDIYVSDVSQEVRNYLDSIKKSYTFVDRNNLTSKSFDVVIAVDEFLTFADSDSDQRSLVEQVSDITKNIFVTTLRDYKNQDFKDREFSLPIAIKSPDNKKIYFEHYEYSTTDRNMFYGTSYAVSDEDVIVIGPFKRRSMFFKQLAKFSFDAGAKNFLVHQNLMHKSIIKKNYEHILTIKF